MTGALAEEPPEMIVIPGGSFEMGSGIDTVRACVDEWSGRLVDPSYASRFENFILKEYPSHSRTIEAFAIARFPVVNREYRRFVEATGTSPCPSIVAGADHDHPAWGMSLDDCLAYAVWVGRLYSKPFRLPSEEEWEYAARGAGGSEYPFGGAFHPAKCNTIEAGLGTTTPVTHYAEWPSLFGVCDMAGNVEEWTSSAYTPYPGGRPVVDDLWEAAGGRPYPILRGGSFALGGDLARCARRHGPHPGASFQYRGFRLAMTLGDDPRATARMLPADVEPKISGGMPDG